MSDISCMSFNILDWDTHHDGYEPAEKRFDYVLKIIEKYDPDLLGVQEAAEIGSFSESIFDWCGKLTAALEERGWAASLLRDQEGFRLEKMNIGCGLIIFYKKDRFTLTDSGCHGYEMDINRYYQWVKLIDEKYKKPVLFTNTHFSIDQKVVDTISNSAGNAYRTVEAMRLLNFWNKNCPPDTALFATGDYNSTPASGAQTLLRSKQFKPSNLVALSWDDCGSMHTSRQFYTLDYCYVNPSAQQIDEYRVIKDIFPADRTEYALAGYPSDHRPLLTRATYKTDLEEAQKL